MSETDTKLQAIEARWEAQNTECVFEDIRWLIDRIRELERDDASGWSKICEQNRRSLGEE